MLFTSKKITITLPLKYDTHTINRSKQHKLLGVSFDDDLSFKSHLSELNIKLSRIISLLYQVKDLMPNYVLKTLYNAHVLPHFQYCSPIWCNTNPTHLVPLFRLQKKIIRIITNSGYFDHTQPLFKDTQILKLFDINKLQIAVFMYKSTNTDYITTLLPQHNYPTRSRDNLRVPQHNLSLFQRSLAYSGPKIWNSVPDYIRLLPTLRSFKKHYKKYIISNY